MFHFEAFLKYFIVTLFVVQPGQAFGASICHHLFFDTFSFQKLSWQESHDLIRRTYFPTTDRWTRRSFKLKLNGGQDIKGETKIVSKSYFEPTLAMEKAQFFESEFNFEVKSIAQAEKVVQEIYSRHKAWLTMGILQNQVYKGRQDLPQSGPSQVLRFEVTKDTVIRKTQRYNLRIWFEYSTEASIAALVSIEILQALLFTGITIDAEALTPRKSRNLRY